MLLKLFGVCAGLMTWGSLFHKVAATHAFYFLSLYVAVFDGGLSSNSWPLDLSDLMYSLMCVTRM